VAASRVGAGVRGGWRCWLGRGMGEIMRFAFQSGWARFWGDTHMALVDESVGRCALLRVPRPAASSLTSAKRIARLIRRSCGALAGKFITTKLQKPAPQREWFGAKNLPETRSGVVIGPCDRALGCEARADNREALYTLCFARVHTPKPHAHDPVAAPGSTRTGPAQGWNFPHHPCSPIIAPHADSLHQNARCRQRLCGAG